MATEYWRVKGDKTRCGGMVREGIAERSIANKPTWPELALPGVHSDIGGSNLRRREF